MKIYKNKADLIKELSSKKNIAFVPTMGSIHKGHLSLIRKAKKESKNVAVSIYVNPKQFNTNHDFLKYPRRLNNDIDLLRRLNIEYLYLPTYKDIYSFKAKLPIYLNNFSKKLCGKYRPGHFQGVINVVNRFLEIIKPSSIFLGVKDFQQLALIKLHINKNKILTKVVSCPTIRQNNGLAFSSRNNKLNKKQIKIAGKLYKYLKKNKKLFFLLKKNNILRKIKLLGVEKVEYLEFVNLKTLKVSKKKDRNYNIFISYYIGGVRLIDNL